MATTASATAAPAATDGLIAPAMTTAFAPAATSCMDNHLTMLENQNYEIWMNYPLPVPDITKSECYPSQFMSSFLASVAGTTEAAFSPLVCPIGYTTVSTSWPAATSYIACCPSSYGFAPNDTAPSTRPAYNAKCYSDLTSGSTLQMTVYGKSSLSNINAFSVSASTMQAYAIPYEGHANETVSPISVAASPTSSALPTTPTAAAAATYTIFAGANAFTPNTINAQAGDSLIFQFQNGNHTVTQSSFETPCEPLEYGFDSGYMPNPASEVPFPSYKLQVPDTNSIWLYSRGDDDCSKGMTFGLNPTSDHTAAEFQQAAISQNRPPSGISRAVKIGVSVGVVVFVLLAAAALAALLVYRRRRRVRAAPADAGPPIDYSTQEFKTGGHSPVPDQKYELLAEGVAVNELADADAGKPVELAAGSRFSEHCSPIISR